MGNKLKKIYPTFYFISLNILTTFLIFFGWNYFLTKKISNLNHFQPVNFQVFKNYQHTPLIKNKIIKGEFTAEYNYLGAIWIKFDMRERIVEDKLIFRIKEKESERWLFENIHDTKFFTVLENYPFGINPIADSQGKKYEFEIEPVQGSPNQAVRLSQEEPPVTLQYHIPLRVVLKDFNLISLFIYPLTLLSFMVTLITLLFAFIVSKKIFRRLNLIVIIIFFGIFWRILLLFSPITFDVRQFVYDIEIFLNKENIYVKQPFYNYTPLYFYLLGIIGWLNRLTFNIPNFVLIRTFLLFIDLSILVFLIKILTLKGKNLSLSGLFFANPLVFITSIHHGQFDNLAIFFILLSYYFYLKNNKRQAVFICLSLALLIKHIVLIPVIFAFFAYFKKIKALILFFLSSLLFFLSFLPFWATSSNLIIKNVFNYQANKTVYGWGYFINRLQNLYPFVESVKDYYIFFFLILGFLTALLISRKIDPVKKILIGFLFFLTFTPGIHSHYFALPVVFSLFSPTIYAVTYYLAVFLFYAPFYAGYSYIAPVNTQSLWIFSFIWLVVELIDYEKIKKVFEK